MIPNAFRGFARRCLAAPRRLLQRLVVPDLPHDRAFARDQAARIDACLQIGQLLAQKTDQLNDKLDHVLARFETLRAEQAVLADDVATLDALSWDRAALARRLAQLEDRLNALTSIPLSTDASDTSDDDPSWPSIRFPGLDRFEERHRTPR